MWGLTRWGKFATADTEHWSRKAVQIAEAEHAVWITGGFGLAMTPAVLGLNGRFSAIPHLLVVVACYVIILGVGIALLWNSPRRRLRRKTAVGRRNRLVEALPMMVVVVAHLAVLVAPSVWGQSATAVLLVAGAILVGVSDRLPVALWSLLKMPTEPPASWTARAKRLGVDAANVMDIESTHAWVRRGPGGSVRVSSEARRLLSEDELTAVVAKVAANSRPSFTARSLAGLRSLASFATLGYLGTANLPLWPLLIIVVAALAAKGVAARSTKQQREANLSSVSPQDHVAALEKLYEANLHSAEPFPTANQPSLHERAAEIGAEPSFERTPAPTFGRAVFGLCAVALLVLVGAMTLAIASDSSSDLAAAVSIATRQDSHLATAYELAAATAQTGTRYSQGDLADYSNNVAVHAAYGLILDAAKECAPGMGLNMDDRIWYCE